MTDPQFDPTDPLFKPLTLAQVLEATGRSRRTIERWVKGGRLTAYEDAHARKVFIEKQVVEAEAAMEESARASRAAIAARAGKPRETPETPPVAGWS